MFINLLTVIFNLLVMLIFFKEIKRLKTLEDQVYIYVKKGEDSYEIRDNFYIYQDDIKNLKNNKSVIARFEGLVTYEPKTDIIIKPSGLPENGTIVLSSEAISLLDKGKELPIFFNKRTIFLGVK